MATLPLAALSVVAVALVPGWLADPPPQSPADSTPAAPAAQPSTNTNAGKPEPPPGEPEQKPVVQRLQEEAALLMPLAESGLAKAFLRATESLPAPGRRVIWTDAERTVAYTPEQAAALPEGERAKLSEKAVGERVYYDTFYGSPLVYARVVDVLATQGGVESLAGKRLLDFGYGSIGHLRLMASLGCDAHGVEVEPILPALYARPEDTGVVEGHAGAPDGRITLHHGRFPADDGVTREIGGGYDIITSKNTLKRGFIHPERPVDENRMIKLGVDDETFLRAVHERLKPGGIFLIYNISPAQNPPDKPYLPHADGRCPFPREMIQAAGFEVLAYDREDSEKILDYWPAIGADRGRAREEMAKDLFAKYTLCRKGAG